MCSKHEHLEYRLDAFDQILGVIGGFAGLIWMTFSAVFGGYEEFKLKTDLLSKFFTTNDLS